MVSLESKISHLVVNTKVLSRIKNFKLLPMLQYFEKPMIYDGDIKKNTKMERKMRSCT